MEQLRRAFRKEAQFLLRIFLPPVSFCNGIFSNKSHLNTDSACLYKFTFFPLLLMLMQILGTLKSYFYDYLFSIEHICNLKNNERVSKIFCSIQNMCFCSVNLRYYNRNTYLNVPGSF